MGVEIERFLRLATALPECTHTESDAYTTFRVQGKPFGYLWPRTATVGLKQTLVEQAALVAERPEVFEVQFTAGGFGWVVVHLDGIDLDELSELTLEAWYLTVPEDMRDVSPTPAALVEASSG
ncbi:MmcQ/YjbR family DNA-binding protein [Nocardiopsis sp. NPDC049922]|uniref:MmcQ/YjbR family DNA-binding protein n=1 Tax=Nocardiopsis sp. NPDC049922 TaxID=3155157 RepID=UPI0033DFA326